jgi:thiol-disulfide isomerase/thioredoxin
MRNYVTIAIIAAVIVAALASVLISGREQASPSSSALVEAAYPLVAGQVQNFILADALELAPVLAFQDADGKPVRLEDFHGQYVLLNLWATWCGPCKREMPSLDRLQAILGGQNFRVLALSEDRTGTEDVKSFFAKIGIENLVIYIDETASSSRKFGFSGLPGTILIDPQGKMVGRMMGPAEWDSTEAVALLRHFAQ